MVKVVLILDESGSMGSVKESILKSVNEFIDKQKIGIKGKEEDTFSLIKFSDVIPQPIPIDNKPMNLVRHIVEYNPSGGTALFDAIGFGIERFKKKNRVIMVVVTDGQENSSQKYKTRTEIQKLIVKQKTEKQWTFIYLSTDIDTFIEANAIGIVSQDSCQRQSKTHNITKNQKDIGDYLCKQVSDGVYKCRTEGNKGGCSFSS